jgi:hypothetical protein
MLGGSTRESMLHISPWGFQLIVRGDEVIG